MPTITVTLDYDVAEQATLFGACAPYPGGQTDAAAQTVIAKWGHPVALRHFCTTFRNPPTNPGFSIVHTSYKQNNDAVGIAAGNYDTQIAALAAATPAGHVVEWMHEHDKKVRDGVVSMSNLVAAKNRFYDVVKANNPAVLVACTVTGWEMDPSSGRDPDTWGVLRGDLFGVDCDGVHPASLPYPEFRRDAQGAIDFIERWAHMGYQGWCVPEFGAPRLSTGDADGRHRAAWMLDYAAFFVEFGARYVCLYDYESSPGNELTTPAELDAWQSLI